MQELVQIKQTESVLYVSNIEIDTVKNQNIFHLYFIKS